MLRKLLLVLGLLIPSAWGALPCAPGQWCWKSSWRNEYLAIPQVATSTFADAAATCANVAANVVTGDAESFAFLQWLVSSNSSLRALQFWTSLGLMDPSGTLVTKPSLSPVLNAPTLNFTLMSPCFADGSCCFGMSSSVGVFGTACPAAGGNWSVICSRNGSPGSWQPSNVSEMELGFFSRMGNYSEAATICANAGGALAYLPSPPASLLALAVGSVVNVSFPIWVGYTTNVVGASVWKVVPSIVRNVSTPFAANISLANRCGAVAANGSFVLANCSESHSFLCQRMMVAVGSSLCNTSSGKLYWYHPSESRLGVTPSQAILQCQAEGGEMTKFASPAELSGCFGMGAAFLTTCYSNGVWGDLSAAPVPSFFASSTGLCTYYNASGPSAGTLPCTAPLSNVCEHSFGDLINASLATSSVTLTSQCTVSIKVVLSRPPAWNESVAICTSGASLSQCVVWEQLSTVTAITIAGADYNSDQVVNFTLMCSPSTLCGNVTLPLSIFMRNVSGNVTLGRLAIDSAGSTSPATYQGVIGVPLTLPSFAISSSAPYTVAVTFSVLSISDSSGCTVTPASATLTDTNQTLTLTAYCSSGSNATMFRIKATIASLDASSCAVANFDGVAVAAVTMVYGKALSIPNATYFGFGPNPTVLVVLPVISSFLGPHWLCLTFVRANVTGATGSNACVSSDASSAASRTVSLTLTPVAQPKQSFVLQYNLTGNAVGVIDMQRSSLNVTVQLLRMNITLDCGLSSIPQYKGLPFAVTASIPFPVPAGYNLTLITVTSAGQPWSNPCSSYLNLSTTQPWLFMQIPVGQVSAQQVYLPIADTNNPSAIWNPNPGVSVLGNASSLFNDPISTAGYCSQSAPFLVILPPSPLNYTQLPAFLFYNAPSYPVTISIPFINPLRNQPFNLSLVCTTCPAGALAIAPSTVSFTSQTNDSQTMRLSALLPLQNAQLVWQFQPQPPQYLSPPNFTLSTRNQSAITPAMVPLQFYFVNTVYSLRLISSAPPPQSNVSVSLGNASAVTVSTAVFNTSNALTQYLLFTVLWASSTQLATLPLVLGGADFSAFFLTTSTVTIAPVLSQVNVTVTNVPVFLLNTTATAVLTVRIDRPPVSYAIVLTLTSSLGLFVQPSTLQWLSSANNSLTFSVSSSTVSNTNAFIAISVSSSMLDGSITNETSPSILWCNTLGNCSVAPRGIIRIPVQYPVAYSILPSTFPFPMRMGDQVNFTLVIGLPPFVGNVSFVFSGVSPYLSVNPSSLLFSSDIPSTRQQFVVTALSPTRSLNLIPTLVGDASVFYFAPPQPICLYIDRAVSAFPTFADLSGLVFVNGQVPVNGTVTMTQVEVEQCSKDGAGFVQTMHQLPIPGTYVTMSLGTSPPGGLAFTPSSLTWKAGDALLRNIVVTPTGQLTGPVSIILNASGNATRYETSTVNVRIRDPSNVSITFPSSGAYPTEELNIIVNVTQLPVVCSSTLVASLICTSPRCDLSGVDVSAPLIFSCSSQVQQQFTLSMQNITSEMSLQLQVVFSGSSLGEYSLNNTVTTSTVTFFPRRKVTVQTPPYIFVASPFIFNITLSAVPDVGTSVHFRAAGFQLTEVVFTSTSPTTQSMSLVSPFMSESGYLNITLIGSTNQETNRYDPIDPVNITVRPKVSMSLFQSPPLRTSQVIGILNNQSVTFVISRPPIFQFTATMTCTSPVPNLLQFDPPFVTFAPEDTVLSRTVTLWGNAIGSASNVRFVLDGFADELADPDAHHQILPALLTVLPLQTVKFNGTFSSMYVGANNNRTIALFISIPCNLPVVVAVNFSFPWAARIVPSQVTFDPLDPRQSRNVTITGLNATTGFLQVSLLSGPEFSPVIDGFMQITIIPRISAAIYSSGRQILPNSTVDLRSDAFTLFDFSVSSIELEVDGVYNLSIVRGTGVSNCIDACYLLKNDSFVFYSAQSIVAGRPSLGFGRSFGIASAAKVADNFTLVITAVDSPKFEQGFVVYFRVAPEPILAVSAPGTLFDGVLNAKTFNVSISYVLPGTTFTYTMSNKSCDTMRIVAARDLTFSQAIHEPVPVKVSCNYSSSPCVLTFRKVPFLQVFPDFLDKFPQDFFLLATASISLRHSPTITPLNNTAAGLPVTLPFRYVQRSTQVLMADVTGGQRLRPYVNFTYALLYAFDDYGIQTAMQTADVIVTTTSTLSDEPKGLLSLRGRPNLFNLTLGNATRFAMSIGPLSDLLLVNNEVVTVMFTSRAFDEGEYPNSRENGLSFVIEKYVASIVASTDLIVVGTLTLAGFAAMPLASPAMIPQLYKTNALLQLFSCPNGHWYNDIWPFPSLDSELDTLPTWMTISVSATGGVLGLTAIHLAAVVIVYFFRRITRTAEITTVTQSGEVAGEEQAGFSTVCGRLHFPAAPFCLIMALAQPITTFSLATLYYSTLPSYRILGFLCTTMTCVVFPAVFHGIVWRSRSLVYIQYLNSSGNWFLPGGFWDHPTSATYLARYWPLFSDLRQNFRWFVLADYLAMMATAATSAVQPSSQGGCVAKVATVCSIVLFQFFGAVFLQPYRFRYLNVMFALVFALQFAGLVMLANQVNQQIRDDFSQTQSLRIFTFSSGLLLATSLSTVIVRCIPHESKSAARKRHYHERELHGDSDEEMGDIDRLEPPPPIVHLSDSDGETDPVAQKLADELAAMPAEVRVRRPVGLFRKGYQGFLKGTEQSFSPSRRRQLLERDQLSAVAPTPALILPDVDSPSRSPASRRYEWVLEAEEDLERERAKQKEPGVEAKRTCRFVESSELF